MIRSPRALPGDTDRPTSLAVAAVAAVPYGVVWCTSCNATALAATGRSAPLTVHTMSVAAVAGSLSQRNRYTRNSEPLAALPRLVKVSAPRVTPLIVDESDRIATPTNNWRLLPEVVTPEIVRLATRVPSLLASNTAVTLGGIYSCLPNICNVR